MPSAIFRFNGGHAWPPGDVARALDMGARTPRFYYLTASARDYGLTLGTRDANRIELTDLGRQLASTRDEAARRRLLLDAYRRVEIFRRVLAHYNDGPLPDFRFLGNTLEAEFGLAPELHREFVEIYNKNYEATHRTEPQLRFDTADEVEPPRAEALPVCNTVAYIGRAREALSEVESSCAILIVTPSSEPGDLPPGFFHEVARSLILPAIEKTGYSSADMSTAESPYRDDFLHCVRSAPLVIADITIGDANAAFAAGVRAGARLPLVLTRASTIPGAVDPGLGVFEYSRNLWPSTVRDDAARLAEIVRELLPASCSQQVKEYGV